MTPVIARAFEKVVYRLHAQEIVEDNLSNSQFAYREGGSCTDALVMIQHKVCKFLDDPNCVAVRMFTMDFSKAFDSVNHFFLANKLKNIPLNPYIVNWWLNFLQDRAQRVVCNNVICNWKQINKGKIQRSVSGPYLFSIYLNDLEISVGEETICFKYTDDCTIVVPVFMNNDSAAGLVNTFLEWSCSNLMKCNPSKCKELVFRKKRHTDVHIDMISNIPQCSELTVLALTFQQDCRFDKHVKSKLGNANKCLYVIRSLRKEGCNQFEVDYLFKTIVLPNVTYALVVYGASEPELTTVQYFLERCYKRRYISARLNIRALLEKQDRKLFSKIFKLSIHPLHKQVPKAKVIDYNLRYKNSARTLINTERFKNAFINRLTYKYDLHM